MSDSLMVMVVMFLIICFIGLTVFMFLNNKNSRTRNIAYSPYQSDYEYENLSNEVDIDVEEDDEDEISFEKEVSLNKKNSPQKKKIKKTVIIYSVWLLFFLSALFIFTQTSNEQLYIIYAGKYNIYDDIIVKMHFSDISEIKEPSFLLAPIDESNGISSFDIAGSEILSNSIKKNRADLLIVDQVILESLKDDLYILDESMANNDKENLLIIDGKLYGIEVTKYSELFTEFTTIADKSYMVIYGSSNNTENALKCMKYYINIVE